MTMKVVCAWCERVITEGDAAKVSHGLCLACHPAVTKTPIQRVAALDTPSLDSLPYGVVQLDAEDRVISYNRVESDMARRSAETVLGRNFFEEVARCTNVQELAGSFKEARAAGTNATKKLEFVFEFSFGRQLMDIRLLYEADTAKSTILIKALGRSKNL
jgi:photoactive yellow protein